MPLADAILRSFFDRERLEVALLHGDREVAVPGYKRAVIEPGAWRHRGTSVSSEVEWRGFGQPVVFDGTALMQGADVLRHFPESGQATIPVGMGYKATIEVDLADI